jgi:uncharacterized membrane protein YecN with MAPEG domain
MLITGFYAALLSYLLIALSWNVITERRSKKIGIGDNNDYELQRRIRAQSNFSEYTPIFLILLSCLEALGLTPLILHTLGLVFLVSRLCHAYGLTIAEKMTDGRLTGTFYRQKGMQGSFISIATAATLILLILLRNIVAIALF